MKRILAPILLFLILILGSLLLPKPALAACQGNIKIAQSGFDPNFNFDAAQNQNTFNPSFNSQITIYIDSDCFRESVSYNLVAHRSNIDPAFNSGAQTSNYLLKPNVKTDGKRSITVPFDLTNFNVGKNYPGSWILKICQDDTKCKKNVLVDTTITVSPSDLTPPPADLPQVFQLENRCAWQTGSRVNLTLGNLEVGKTYKWWWHGDTIAKENIQATDSAILFFIEPEYTQQTGTKTFCLDSGTFGRRCTPGSQNSKTFKFLAAPPEGNISCTDIETGGTIQRDDDSLPPPCKALDSKGECLKVSTAIGDIGTNPTAFIKDIFSILLGVSGGIALILIIISGYRLMASQGNPEKVQEAREMLTSAVVGLLFIIFSLVILQIIGVSILQIPGFSG